MDKLQKERLYHLIKRMDTKCEIVRIDLESNFIEYNQSVIKLHEKIENLTDEEFVRAYLVTKLNTRLGYMGKHTIQLENPYTIGKPPKAGAELDILITKEDDYPFAMFELKAPEKYEEEMDGAIKEQLFKVAPGFDVGKESLQYLIYYTVYISEDDEPIEKMVTINYRKFNTFDTWDHAGKPNLMSIASDYGIVTKPVFVKGIYPDLRVDVTADELERIRWNIHGILWHGGKYHIELFFNLMGILLAKIYDEKETEDAKPYLFQIFYKNGQSEEPEDIANRINDIYRKALKQYLGYTEEELKKARDIVFDFSQIKYVVEILQGISLTRNRYDVLGNFFEKIVRNEFKQSKGQYLTHTNIVNFIIRVLEIENLALHLINEEKRLPYIIDPACGSGTFLIESMKVITSTVAQQQQNLKKSTSVDEFVAVMFPPARENAWADKFMYGIEINTDLATATKVNMVGHGDGSANIEATDALIDFERYTKDLLQVKKTSPVYEKQVNEQFDVVVSNPPFSITVDRDTARDLPKIFIWGEQIKKSLEKAKTKMEVSIENLFVERWYQLLRPKGRLGVVLPDSLFDATTSRYVRLFLYKYFWVKAIVSLPELAFQPYTPTKTSLLFAQKKTVKEVNDWERDWNKYEKEYKELKKKIDGLLKVTEKSPTYEISRNELVSGLRELLFDNFDESYADKEIEVLEQRHFEDIKSADIDWWVFYKISEKHKYNISMAHAEEIGYKRGVRGVETRQNQLFNIDTQGNIVIDRQDTKTILDYLRKYVKWSY